MYVEIHFCKIVNLDKSQFCKNNQNEKYVTISQNLVLLVPVKERKAAS